MRYSYNIIYEFSPALKLYMGWSILFIVTESEITSVISLIVRYAKGASSRALETIYVGCIAIAYYIAITTESPLKVLGLFFVAVLLVIAGTYMLFTAGSIAVLKMLRKNKKFYYHKRHFTAVSGMLYRMKQNCCLTQF